MRRTAVALLALLAAACEHDHGSCCAKPPPEIQVNVVNVAGEPVADARVAVWREGGEEGSDTITGEAAWRDAARVAADTTDEIGFLSFHGLGEGAYRVTVTPPAGYVFADSSTDTYFFTMDERGRFTRFVLERAAKPRVRSTP